MHNIYIIDIHHLDMYILYPVDIANEYVIYKYI